MPLAGGEKTERLLRLRSQQGRAGVTIVRELYLREDIPCYSPECLGQCEQWRGRNAALLQAKASHYLVPDCQVTCDFLEMLELPEITNLIITHTVIQAVQQEGRRLYRRLQALLRNPAKYAVTFHNDFQKYAYCKREPGEAQEDWQARSVFRATEWYVSHLAEQIPVIMITSKPEVVKKYSTTTYGAHVMTIKEYLQNLWPDLTTAHQLWDSLTAASEAKNTKGNKEYEAHLPTEILQAGLKSGLYIKGRLNVNKHNAQNEAWLRPSGTSGKDTNKDHDVLISGAAHRNRAVHGDLVAVELLPKKLWRSRSSALTTNDGGEEVEDEGHEVMPTGRVVAVLQRAWRDYVASFDQNQESGHRKADRVLVIPMDWRIPKIRIKTSHIESLKSHRIIVRIDSWDASSQYPAGHFVRSVGVAGELETEIECLLLEHSIAVSPFSKAVLSEMPVNTEESPWQMEREEIDRRKDLRQSHLVFSIDPKGCEDVDDTLSVRKLKNGCTELGVHIADVSFFVKAGSTTDAEAGQRSTTVYLADRRYDMLPAVLSSDLCSLISGVDRYAMSVIWTLDDSYEVIDVWYGRTVIRSSYKLYYEIAQELVDGAEFGHLVENIPELQPFTPSQQLNKLTELIEAVSQLMTIARVIHSRRSHQGALELEGVEVQVQIDKSSEKQEIQDLIPKQPLEVHETIAECMIFANHWVAKKICQAFPSQSLLRRHPLPRQEHFTALHQCAEAHGFHVNTTSNKLLAESLDACVDPSDPNVNKILRSLATQAMSNASYFSTGSVARDDFAHYGLGLDFYTHFTSPIRRYADILVHRQLLAAINTDKTYSDTILPNSQLQETAEHINHKHRAAQDAQKLSVEIFQCLYFKDKDPSDPCCSAEAIVVQIRSNGLLTFVPRYGMRGAVFLRDREGQVRYVMENGHAEWMGGSVSSSTTSITVQSVLGSQTYHLMQHVTVKISIQESHAHASSVRMELLSDRALKSHTEMSDQKAHIIKEVTVASEEKNLSTVDLGADFDRWKAEYGQTDKEKSFYNLIQDLNDMAMLQNAAVK